MKFIIEHYMDIIDTKCKFPFEKREYVRQLLSEVKRIEEQNDTTFSKFHFSRTNEDGNVEEYQVICFDVFGLLIKEVYDGESLIDVNLFYDEPVWNIKGDM